MKKLGRRDYSNSFGIGNNFKLLSEDIHKLQKEIKKLQKEVKKLLNG